MMMSSLRLGGLLAFLGACNACSSTPSTTGNDGGADANSGDSSAQQDSSAEAATDGSVPGAPMGFSLAAAGQGPIHVSMALDENDDPLIAYVIPASPNRVEYVRWDRTTAAWTMPVVVDSVGTIDNNAPHRETSIAYDASTKTIGIAFQKQVGNVYVLALSLSTDGGKTFSIPVTVSEALPNVSNQNTHDAQMVMAGGKTHIAYVQEWQLCSVGNCSGAYYQVRTGNSGTFTRTALNIPAQIAARTSPVSLALDGTGAPAVAFFGREMAGYNTPLYFVRPGSMSVKVTDSNNVQNDTPSMSLAFDGTKPRIATHLVAVPPMAPYEMRFAASNDGAAWTVTPVARGGGTQESSLFQSLAVGPSGKLALAANWGSGAASGCSGPILLTSTDAMNFSGCGPAPKTFTTSGQWVNLAYAKDGKLRMAFSYGGSDFQKGVVFWRE